VFLGLSKEFHHFVYAKILNLVRVECLRCSLLIDFVARGWALRFRFLGPEDERLERLAHHVGVLGHIEIHFCVSPGLAER